MLMSDHMTEIDHIIHDLDQIEMLEFDDRLPTEPLLNSQILAKEIREEFMDLLRDLELEEFEHSGIIYDSIMIGKMCLASYYMSRFGHQNLYNMGLTMEETAEKASKMIGCNPESLLHMKSVYDEFFLNKRTGKEQTVILNADMLRTMRECEAMTEVEVGLECKKWFRKHE